MQEPDARYKNAPEASKANACINILRASSIYGEDMKL